MLLRLGVSEIRGGDIEAGRATLIEAIELARRAGDTFSLGEAVRRYFEHRPPQAYSDGSEAQSLLEEALAATAGHESETRVQLLTDAANSLHLSSDLTRRAELSDEAIATAHQTGDARTIGLAITGKIGATWAPSTRTWRLKATEEAQRWAMKAGPVATDTTFVARSAQLGTLLESGRRVDFDRALKSALSAADEFDQTPRIQWCVRSWIPLATALDGDFEQALQQSAEIAEAAELIALEAGAAKLAHETMIALVRRETSALRPLFERIALADSNIAYLGILAVMRAIDGDHGAVRGSFDALAGAIRGLPDDMTTAIGLATLSEASWIIGDDTLAVPLAEAITPIADHHAVVNIYGGGGMYFGCLRHALAQCQALLGSADARATASAAIEAHDRMRSPVFVDRSRDLRASLSSD
jgi:hypothetical protein